MWPGGVGLGTLATKQGPTSDHDRTVWIGYGYYAFLAGAWSTTELCYFVIKKQGVAEMPTIDETSTNEKDT